MSKFATLRHPLFDALESIIDDRYIDQVGGVYRTFRGIHRDELEWSVGIGHYSTGNISKHWLITVVIAWPKMLATIECFGRRKGEILYKELELAVNSYNKSIERGSATYALKRNISTLEEI